MAAPIDLSEGVSSAAKQNWTRLNHLHVEGVSTSKGYAYCDNCGAVENEEDSSKPCPKGPVRKFNEAALYELVEHGSPDDEVSQADLLSHGIEEAGKYVGFGLQEIAAAIRQHNQ